MDRLPSGWFAGIRSQGVELWSKLGTPVKLMLAGVGLAVIAAAAFGLRSGGPQYVALPGQPYDPKDLEPVVAKLSELKVPYTQSADGSTVLVPQDRLLDARLALAQAGVTTGPVGYEIFEQSNLGATDFERQVNLLRAMEGELSRAIGAMSPVQAAVVKLAIPERTVFIREQKPVKAAVMVQPRTGRQLSAAEVEGIVRFLAGAVADLDVANVMVVDHTGKVLAAGLLASDQTQQMPSESGFDRQLAFQQSLERNLQAMLEGPLGPGNVTVMVNAKLNLQASREESTTYTNPGPGGEALKRSSQTATVSFEGDGLPPDQTAGLDANTVTPPTYQAAAKTGTSTYESRQSTENYEVNEVKRVVQRPPGEVESISVGVFVNEAVIAADNTAKLQQIQQVVASAVGAPLELVTVATMPFNNDLVKALSAAPAAPSANLPWQTMAGAGLGALALLFFLMFVARRRRPAFQPALAGAGGPGLALDPAAGRADDFPARRRVEFEEHSDLVGDELAAQLGLDPARKKLRGEVDKLAKQSPDLVASLVRAWMTEEKK